MNPPPRLSCFVLAIALPALLTTGCSVMRNAGIEPSFSEKGPMGREASRPQAPAFGEEAVLRANYAAGDELARQLKRHDAWVSGAVIVATPSDVSKLDTSTPLGRISGEQVASRLAQQGFHILEVRQMDALDYSPTEGVFNLTQDAAKAAASRAAWAVVCTTYAPGRTGVLVSLRAVAASNSEILASVDYVLPRDPTLLSSSR